MDLLNGHPMHQRLGLGQPPEDSPGPLLDRFGQTAARNHGVDPGIVPMCVEVIDRHIKLQGSHVPAFGEIGGKGV